MPAARTLLISEVIRYERRVFASLHCCDLALNVFDEDLIAISLCNLQHFVEALKLSSSFGFNIFGRHWTV